MGFRANDFMKTLSDITPQFIRNHYYDGDQAIIETSVFTFDNPKYYVCAGIKNPLLCSTVSITRHREGSITVRLFGPAKEEGSCTCTKLFYDKRVISVHDLYVNLRTFIFLKSMRFVLKDPTSVPFIEIKNIKRFLNS